MFWYTICGLVDYWFLKTSHHSTKGITCLLETFFNFWPYFWNIYSSDPSLFTYIHLHKIPLFTDFRILWAVYSLGNIIRPRLKTLRLLSSLLLPLERHRHRSMYYHSLSIYTIEAGPNDNTTHIFSIHSSSSSVSIYSCVKPL